MDRTQRRSQHRCDLVETGTLVGTGWIFNIQRFSVQDGPGIRTTVFMKGCPLACPWCSNPESQKFHPELAHVDSLCDGCGHCRLSLDGCHVDDVFISLRV